MRKKIFIIKSMLLISICLLTISINAQQAHTVTGNVIDSDNQKMPGVNVVEKGTNVGTVTDINGNFSIDVTDPVNSVLIFSFIGYNSEEVAVEGMSSLEVMLIPGIEKLDEVVVIGYGTQKVRDLTGSIGQVRADEISRTPSIGIDQVLQGRLAGVYVTQDQGQPGGAVSVRIRGTNSIHSQNDPLYVVDGVPLTGGLNGISYQDIESINVLKDASAAAIYGARGSNGVVLVTTKKGEAGKTMVNFHSYVGIQNAWKKPSVNNALEYSLLQNEMFMNIDRKPYLGDLSEVYIMAIEEYNSNTLINETTPLDSFPVNTNWNEVAFRNARIQNHQMSVSGGNDRSYYYMSLGYMNQEGILVGSWYERLTGRINAQTRVGKRLTFGNNLSFSRHESENKGGALYTARFASPLVPEEFPDGTPGSPVVLSKNRSRIGSVGSPYIGMRNPSDAHYFKVIANIYSEVEFLKDFKYKLNLGSEVDVQSSFNHRLPYDYISPINPVATSTAKSVVKSTTGRESYALSWLVEHTLEYRKMFGRHNVQVLGGLTYQEWESRYVQGDQRSFTHPFYQELSDGDDTNMSTGGGYTDWGMIGYLGRVTYSFDNKYLLQGNIRRDGSSKFGPLNRWGVFPSVSAGWVLNRESFLQDVDILNNLKIRASYGELGNDKIPSLYGWQTTLEQMNYSNGNDGGVVPGQAPTKLPNTELQWETLKQTNIGVDVDLMDNRFSFTADYYIKRSEDMLIQIPIPAHNGFLRTPFVNAGTMQNSGFEFLAGYSRNTGEFKWEVNLNFATNNNELVSLAGDKEPLKSINEGTEGYWAKTEIGYPIGRYFGYVVDGIFQTREEIDALNVTATDPSTGEEITTYFQEPTTSQGDIKFKDINGRDEEGNLTGVPDGKIDDADRTYIGNPHPDFFYGLSGRASWNSFELSFFLQGVHGNDILNMVRMDSEGMYNFLNQSTSTENRWRSPVYEDINTGERYTVFSSDLDLNNPDFRMVDPGNPGNGMPRAAWNDPSLNNRFSDRFVEDGSFLRIKNITLSYTIPSVKINKIGASNLRIYFSVNNLFTFTKYSGLDPEIGNYRSWETELEPVRKNLDIGVDRGNYPVARSFLVGISLDI